MNWVKPDTPFPPPKMSGSFQQAATPIAITASSKQPSKSKSSKQVHLSDKPIKPITSDLPSKPESTVVEPIVSKQDNLIDLLFADPPSIVDSRTMVPWDHCPPSSINSLPVLANHSSSYDGTLSVAQNYGHCSPIINYGQNYSVDQPFNSRKSELLSLLIKQINDQSLDSSDDRINQCLLWWQLLLDLTDYNMECDQIPLKKWSGIIIKVGSSLTEFNPYIKELVRKHNEAGLFSLGSIIKELSPTMMSYRQPLVSQFSPVIFLSSETGQVVEYPKVKQFNQVGLSATWGNTRSEHLVVIHYRNYHSLPDNKGIKILHSDQRIRYLNYLMIADKDYILKNDPMIVKLPDEFTSLTKNNDIIGLFGLIVFERRKKWWFLGYASLNGAVHSLLGYLGSSNDKDEEWPCSIINLGKGSYRYTKIDHQYYFFESSNPDQLMEFPWEQINIRVKYQEHLLSCSKFSNKYHTLGDLAVTTNSIPYTHQGNEGYLMIGMVRTKISPDNRIYFLHRWMWADQTHTITACSPPGCLTEEDCWKDNNYMEEVTSLDLRDQEIVVSLTRASGTHLTKIDRDSLYLHPIPYLTDQGKIEYSDANTIRDKINLVDAVLPTGPVHPVSQKVSSDRPKRPGRKDK